MKNVRLALTLPEARHLLRLLARNEEDGIRSGEFRSYWTRHNRLLKKLTRIIEEKEETP